ncbi:hypothetical protein [Anabaena sp. UHCC 0451]|uniref:hypothetical protein n=1 Tax=Anabaena sp. UHCC 0451 TaxID=2055235 RepID=UPI002B201C75|nr:hypothetical protein [Anabaena sp. UHCC 0451]MEA5576844.1 hypothetical protein [Anabaena sp. UHCC 0451]
MKEIIIADLKTHNENSLFHELSLAETSTISGGTLNNYFITTNAGDVNGPSTGDIKGVDSGIRDNKVNTIDYSRSTYIVINSL